MTDSYNTAPFEDPQSQDIIDSASVRNIPFESPTISLEQFLEIYKPSNHRISDYLWKHTSSILTEDEWNRLVESVDEKVPETIELAYARRNDEDLLLINIWESVIRPGLLKKNDLTGNLEWRERPIDIKRVYVKIGQTINFDGITKKSKWITDTLMTLLDEDIIQVKNPIVDYIDSLPSVGKDKENELRDFLKKRLGIDDFEATLAVKWLIAGIARVKKPGCKMDNVLVLFGTQGIRKSSFLESLFGDYYNSWSSGKKDAREKDLLLKSSWCLDLAEIDGHISIKDLEALKQWITQTKDTVRPLYTDCFVENPRRCVLAGTTNRKEFLCDSTGNRRFWVVDCQNQSIDPVTDEERDFVWSVAKFLYEKGEKWYLNKDEEKELTQRNQNTYEDVPVIAQEAVETINFLVENPANSNSINRDGRMILIPQSTLFRHMGINGSKLKRWEKDAIEKVLEQHGFEKKEVRKHRYSFVTVVDSK